MKKLSLLFFIATSLSTSFGMAEDPGGLYTFDPKHIKRDPFLPSSGSLDTQGLLIAYDVTRFQLIAIMTGMGTPRAMLLLPNRDTEVVKLGDRLGKNGGRIQKITDSEIVIKEAYKDYQGKERTYFTSLVIAD